MTRESKVDADEVSLAMSQSTVRGEGERRFAMLPRWASPQVGSVASRKLLGADTEFSHLALGTYPIYRLKGAD